MPRRALLSVPACALLIAGAACSPRGTPAQVSEDEVLQARYLAARRTLDEVRALKKRGKSIYADCKGLDMLLTRELRRLGAPAVRQLIDEIETTCKGAQPAEP